jgi:hypothetical protein
MDIKDPVSEEAVGRVRNSDAWCWVPIQGYEGAAHGHISLRWRPIDRNHIADKRHGHEGSKRQRSSGTKFGRESCRIRDIRAVNDYIRDFDIERNWRLGLCAHLSAVKGIRQ